MSLFEPRILIISPAWLGDLILTQTLMRYIRFKHPHALIDILAPPFAKALLGTMPEVNTVLPFPSGHGQLDLGTRYRLSQDLRQRAYDQALILPRSIKSALIPWLAKIPKRTGYLGEYRYGLINQIVPYDQHTMPLMVQRFLRLMQDPSEPVITQARILQQFRPILSTPYSKTVIDRLDRPKLALCPGAAYGDAKRWPLAHFAKLARYALNQDWKVVLLGGQAEIELGQTLDTLTEYRCDNQIGKTELIDAVQILAQADWVVSNDSGLMHMAAALDKPLIALFGSSDPRYTPPLSHRAQILSLHLPCSPCFKRTCPLHHHACLSMLSPEQVIHAMGSDPFDHHSAS